MIGPRKREGFFTKVFSKSGVFFTKMLINIEPPLFIDSRKKFSEYKKDLLRWSRLTSIKPELQAELVVYKLEGHSSNIKEKIVAQLGDVLEGNKDGIEKLLQFLETIYGEDDMAEDYGKYVDFKNKKRKEGESIQAFIAEWEHAYQRCKNMDCALSDKVLCFELLQASRLQETEIQLVLTGVDYEEGKKNNGLLEMMKASLKKFKGRMVIGKEEVEKPLGTELTIRTEENGMSKEVETYLVKKGWSKPKKRKRSYSDSAKSGYLGRKNMLDNNGIPLKCHTCKCNHTKNCTCPCVYHFADKCPKKSVPAEKETAQTELGLFMQLTNNGSENISVALKTSPYQLRSSENILEEEVCLLSANFEQLVYSTNVQESRALIDCACPSTVAGLTWVKKMISQLTIAQKKKVIVESSNRIYKFGGGERRASKYSVKFPCNLAGKNIFIKTEVIDENLPLLLGNTSLKAARAILIISEEKAILLDQEVEMREEASGHFSLIIGPPNEMEKRSIEADECLIMQQE